jgi:hypothetical protein
MARLVSEKEAAESIGLDVATFRNWVAAGKLPKAIPECGKFDIKALDLALDRLSGLGGASNALDAWKAKGQHARTS